MYYRVAQRRGAAKAAADNGLASAAMVSPTVFLAPLQTLSLQQTLHTQIYHCIGSSRRLTASSADVVVHPASDFL